LYVVDAVAVDSANRRLPVGDNASGLIFDYGLDMIKVETLGNKMLGLETEITEQTLRTTCSSNNNTTTATAADLVLVDGSLAAWFTTRRKG
jgi:hypothetical protein